MHLPQFHGLVIGLRSQVLGLALASALRVKFLFRSVPSKLGRPNELEPWCIVDSYQRLAVSVCGTLVG